MSAPQPQEHLMARLNKWLAYEGAPGRDRKPIARKINDISDEFDIAADEKDKHPGYLGKGSYGLVQRYKKKEGTALPQIPAGPVAVKTIAKARVCHSENALRHMMIEILVLRKLRHPNIIKLFDVMQTEDRIYLVMELCPGGELYFFISGGKAGKCTPEDSAVVLKQVLLALQYCHDNNVVHRDIKPENILIDPATKMVKLIDFGLAKFLQRGLPGMDAEFDPTTLASPTPAPHGMSTAGVTPGGTHVPESPLVAATPCGTELYMALESIRGILHGLCGENKWFTTRGRLPKVDVYAAGVIGYAMLTGRLPYKSAYRPGARPGERHRRLHDLEDKMTMVSFPFPRTSAQLPMEALECIRDLMNHEILARPSAKQGAMRAWLIGVQVPGDAHPEEAEIEVPRHKPPSPAASRPKPARKPGAKRPGPARAPLPQSIVTGGDGQPAVRTSDPNATPIVFVDDEELQEAHRPTPTGAKEWKDGWKAMMRDVRGEEDDDIEEKDADTSDDSSITDDTQTQSVSPVPSPSPSPSHAAIPPAPEPAPAPPMSRRQQKKEQEKAAEPMLMVYESTESFA
eukprot:TRINITY_DN4355_c0_g1_i3.p1 TRINITY_DN4355_c0_g1~~TRINITY_DN4355_c0_g1_i3.p1  ORF type:complete len:571 (+),score=173.85 TRINITY_DN4355_c0_g1_i3:99-1811(+)